MPRRAAERSSVFMCDWQEMAARLARVFPGKRLHRRALDWLAPESKRGAWHVACSGGADSVCLLLLLYAHFPGRRDRMRVLHFNHRLRGDESDRDAEWVAEVAGALGLEAVVGVWTGAPAAENVTEEAAREARFAFFDQTAAGENVPVPLFLGHQRDDIVESQLMRISRGSGSAGLAAPRPLTLLPGGRVRLRPLLGIPGAEIREALRAIGVPWREDSSNRRDTFYRNRIRSAVLPAWREASPFDVSGGAARTRRLLEEDNDALEAWTDRALGPVERGAALPVRRLRDEPAAIRRRALERWLAMNALRAHLSARAVSDLSAALEEGSPARFSAGETGFLVFDGTVLRWAPSGRPGKVWAGEVICPRGGEVFFPGGGVLRAETVEPDGKVESAVRAGETDPRREVYLDLDALAPGELIVRPWRPGDRYRPLGAPGARKLQDVFTDRRIDPEERRRLPVVCMGNGTIVWCPGLPPADSVKLGDSTKRVARLTYDGGPATLKRDRP